MDKKQPDEPEEFIQLGGKPEKSDITLRFFGDELDPAEISKLLQSSPTSAYRKGEKNKYGIAETGSWLKNNTVLGKKNVEQNLEEQITDLFDKLPQDLEIWQGLSKRFDADIYCGAWLKGWNRDVWFNKNILKQISDRGLQIGIAIYCECDDDETDELTEKLNE